MIGALLGCGFSRVNGVSGILGQLCYGFSRAMESVGSGISWFMGLIWVNIYICDNEIVSLWFGWLDAIMILAESQDQLRVKSF